MSQMNWKKFILQYKTLKSWLEEQGHSDGINIVQKIAALILCGYKHPEIIINLAVANISLNETIIKDTFTDEELVLEVPEHIYNLVGHWVYTLPRNTILLGEIYEKLVVGRRKQGVYYTPPEIIDFIMAQTVAACDIIKNPKVKILDPACGCGYFLAKAYDILWDKFGQARSILAEKYPMNDWSDDGIHRHILQYNLWGADIDQGAVEITVAGLVLKRPQVKNHLQLNIIVYDSLKRPEDIRASLEVKAFWAGSYDYVVGNPPYLSFGLRGVGSLKLEYQDYLRRAYYASAEYKLSYYVLFMQRGIEMLVEGGQLGFIVPDSFLLGRYYSKIRHFLMEHTVINAIAHITAPVFKGAATGYLAICILTKESNHTRHEDCQVNIYQINNMNAFKEARPLCQYRQSYFASLPHNRFRIFFDLKAKKIIDHLERISTHLGNFASGHTGVRSISRQSDIIADRPYGDSWRRGLVSGKQICRYGLKYEGHWLNIDPAMLYKGGWQPDIIQARKILVRQTGYTLTACIDDAGFYHLNNIHSFVLRHNRSEIISLDYLLLLINSRLMAFYYHVISMEFGRSMAQTDIETLELLPIRVHDSINHQAKELVRIMQDCVHEGMGGDNQSIKKAESFDGYLNQLVYRIYELTDEEIAYIESYESRLATRRICRISTIKSK